MIRLKKCHKFYFVRPNTFIYMANTTLFGDVGYVMVVGGGNNDGVIAHGFKQPF